MTTPEKIEVDDVELKTIELRLNSVKEATHRSRAVFLIMTVTCAMILFGLWNAIVSWDRGLSTKERNGSPTVIANQKAVTEEWFKNLVISVGLLGIRVSVNDLAVIGSSSLVVIMVWFFFCQRRENRAIVSLLRYCYIGDKDKQLSKDVCNLVYEGIVQSIVFIDMGGGDDAIEGLQINNLGESPIPTGGKANAEQDNEREINHSVIKSTQQTSFIRKILILLAYLPPITIFMIIIADISSIFLVNSYVRANFAKLYEVLFDGNHNYEIAKIIVFEVFAILCCVYTYRVCGRCREFSTATAKTIKIFEEEVLKIKN